jgi:hypothetical protein
MTSLAEQIRLKRQATQDKRVGGKNAYKFKNGVTTIRILPGWRKDDTTFSHSFGQSFIKDFDGKVVAVVGDAKLTYGQDEPLRDAINKALGDADTDGSRKHFKEMLAKPRELVNGLVLDDREVDPNTPQIIDFSETQFDQILEQVELAGITEEFLDLENGFNLKVSKTGTKFDTKYTFAFERKPSAVSPAVMELDAYVRSKFANHDKAMNAVRAISQGQSLSDEPKALSYSGNADVVEGSFTETTDDDAPFDGGVEIKQVSSDDIDKYFQE